MTDLLYCASDFGCLVCTAAAAPHTRRHVRSAFVRAVIRADRGCNVLTTPVVTGNGRSRTLVCVKSCLKCALIRPPAWWVLRPLAAAEICRQKVELATGACQNAERGGVTRPCTQALADCSLCVPFQREMSGSLPLTPTKATPAPASATTSPHFRKRRDDDAVENHAIIPAAPASKPTVPSAARKRKTASKPEAPTAVPISAVNDGPHIDHPVGYHLFHPPQVASFRRSLLAHYTASRRRLPWRGDASESFGKEEMKERGKGEGKERMKDALAGAASSSAESADANSDGAAPSAQVYITRPVSAYGVWVSEIMLQQTRVETVIAYWQRWMARFPTIESLAKATVDEVNSMWAGLGYYRRARFLLEGAKAVMEKQQGVMPSTVEGLLSIPGIGPYTAGAIASIAFGVRTPLVDGNVIRVLSRVRAADVDPKNRNAEKAFWVLAEALVNPPQSAEDSAVAADTKEDPSGRPGDFNQALMELGALICTPVNPKCSECPVRRDCYAYREVEQKKRPCDIPAAEKGASAHAESKEDQANSAAQQPMVIDIEDLTSDEPKPASSPAPSNFASNPSRKPKSIPPPSVFSSPSSSCTLCDARSSPPTAVSEYPRKAVKKAPLEQHVAVTVLRARFPSGSGEWKYLLIKRPEEGLLAGQWEFPSLILPDAAMATPKGTAERRALLIRFLSVQFSCSADSLSSALGPLEYVNEMTHVFSHRRHLMRVERTDLTVEELGEMVREERVIVSTSGDAADGKPSKKKVKLSASKSKKSKNDADSDGDDQVSDGEAELSSAVSPVPQSYRWVSLSSLREDHASSSGSELGLTTGQRKIVKMLDDGKIKGGAGRKAMAATGTKSKKTLSAAEDQDAMEIDLADDDASPVDEESDRPIELAEEDSGEDVLMMDEQKEAKAAPRSTKKSPAKSRTGPSKPRSSSKKAAGAAASKAQPSLLSFFGTK
jgi:A/G-specific adenine glycosylase